MCICKVGSHGNGVYGKTSAHTSLFMHWYTKNSSLRYVSRIASFAQMNLLPVVAPVTFKNDAVLVF